MTLPEPTRPMAPVAAVLIWLVAVLGFGLMALAILGAIFNSYMDCSIGIAEGREEANTTLGWAIAGSSVVAPALVAVALAGLSRWRPLLLFAAVTMAIQVPIWYWLLTPDCA